MQKTTQIKAAYDSQRMRHNPTAHIDFLIKVLTSNPSFNDVSLYVNNHNLDEVFGTKSWSLVIEEISERKKSDQRNSYSKKDIIEFLKLFLIKSDAAERDHYL